MSYLANSNSLALALLAKNVLTTVLFKSRTGQDYLSPV